MSRTLLPFVFAAEYGTAQAGGVSWRLASAGQSCTDSCSSTGSMTCQTGHWPTSAAEVQRIARELAFTCTGTQTTSQSMGPVVHNYGGCFYPSSVSSVSCSSAPTAGYQRLCPCGSQDLRFIMASKGSECSEACLRRGGQCETAPAVWPQTQADLEHAVRQTGHQCTSTASSAAHHAPYVESGSCYWAASSSVVSCDAFSAESERICPCLGANEHDPLSLTPGQPIHHSQHASSQTFGSSGGSGSSHSGSSYGSGSYNSGAYAGSHNAGTHSGSSYNSGNGNHAGNSDNSGSHSGSSYNSGSTQNAGLGYNSNQQSGTSSSTSHSGNSFSSGGAQHAGSGASHSGSSFHSGSSHNAGTAYSGSQAGSHTYSSQPSGSQQTGTGSSTSHSGSSFGGGRSHSAGTGYSSHANSGSSHSYNSHQSGNQNFGGSSSSSSSSLGGTSSSHSAQKFCKGGGFRQGQKSGGTQSKFAATFSTEDACRGAVEDHCPSANGATFSPALGECWCNLAMIGYAGEPTLRTCWFEPSTTQLWQKALLVQSSPMVMVVGIAFVVAASIGAITGLLAVRRLKPKQDAADSSAQALVHNQASCTE